MALYRQIAGVPNGDPEQIGKYIGFNLYTNPVVNDGITPVDYTIPIEQPTIPIADTGGGAFTDPRLWDWSNATAPSIDTGITPIQTINPSQPVIPTEPPTPSQPGTPSVLPADAKTAITNNILPLLALAAVVVVAVKGDDLLHEKRKVALLGGLGLLYYGMAKNKLV